jgi:large subunit ribosomal protein L6
LLTNEAQLLEKLRFEIMETKYVYILELVGVGYKAISDSSGRKLTLKLGFSHDIELKVPVGVRVFCPGRSTLICCTGMNRQVISQFAAKIRSCKPPEVYKGKGIRYRNEIIFQKEGKKK